MERAPEALPSEPRISVACQGLILMDVGYQGLDWQVDEYSRARTGRMLAVTVQSRMVGGEYGERWRGRWDWMRTIRKTWV